MDKTLNLFGLSRKAGSLELGEDASGAAVRSGKAKVLMLANDASENARRRAEGFVFETNIPLITLPYAKADISWVSGKRGCSMAAITDIGFAHTILSSLAAVNAEEYGEISEIIKAREEKSKQRKKESLAHDRNKKFGKKRASLEKN
jgi:Ribosomal protein HS6-type (S12/L30/L7a)